VVLSLAAGLLAAALPAPASASAPSPTYAETRVRGFELQIPAGVEAERGLSQTGTEAYSARYDELAAGYPLFPRWTLPPPSRVPNAGGVIRSFVTEQDEVSFRVFTGDARTGGFLVRARPGARAQAIEGLTLPPGNEAQFIQEVLVPAGTRLQRSRALPAFGRRGGMEQFELLDLIPEESFGPGVPFQ